MVYVHKRFYSMRRCISLFECFKYKWCEWNESHVRQLLCVTTNDVYIKVEIRFKSVVIFCIFTMYNTRARQHRDHSSGSPAWNPGSNSGKSFHFDTCKTQIRVYRHRFHWKSTVRRRASTAHTVYESFLTNAFCCSQTVE